jgi:hypothetical protein
MNLHPLHAKRCLTATALAVAAISTTVPLSASAQASDASSGHVLAGVGSGRLQLSCTDTVACDGRAAALQLGAGLTLAPMLAGGRLALEARWIRFGESQLANAGLQSELRNQAFLFGATWRRPFAAQWAASLGAGLARVSTSWDARPLGGAESSGTDVAARAYILAGLHYLLSTGTSIDLVAVGTQARYQLDGLSLGHGRLNAVTLGFTQTF